MKWIFTTALIFTLLLALFWFSSDLGLEQISGLTTYRPVMSEKGSYDLRFCAVDDCEGAILSAIGNATSVHCAFYDLNEPKIVELLKEKSADVVVYRKNYDDKRLSFATPVPAHHGGLMHDKFCILDDKTVITGSMNPTTNGVEKNDNNIILINGSFIAKNYLSEFKELKGGVERKVTFPLINQTVENRSFLIENRFCPEDGCEEAVLKSIGSAKESVNFLTFSFTSNPIGNLLLEKEREGVEVKGVFERRSESKYSEYKKLLSAGIDVRLDGNPATMHHKVFIIDGGTPDATVILGSYNPTKSGNTRNDENILIIHDQDIAGSFLKEFKRVYGMAE